jgi:hypothetical protein
MNEEPKFQLTRVQRTGRGEPEPCLTFQVLDQATGNDIAYGAVFRVCATPRCPCESVCVHCEPLLPDGTAAPGSVRQFWLDVRKRVVKITPELKADLETLRLAELISTRLADAAWEELHRWFWIAKIEAIETAEVSEIDIADLPNADDGHMVPFIEVFPLGLSLNFTFANAAWAADEAYCVQPGCDCTQGVLSFLQLKDAAGRVATSLHGVPALRYNYRSQTARQLAAGPTGTPPAGQLLTALKAAYPSLDLKLELHHRIMQFLYARHYLAQARLERERLEAQLPARAQKTGRNDPCPCGSGKKFKKCCGA